jgi:CBS domain-containing protein
MARSDPSITIGFGGTAARPTPFLEYGERQEISEIMTRSVDLIDPNAPATEAARKTREDDVGILPVGENDRLVGMMTDRDIVMRGLSSDGSVGRASVRDVMSKVMSKGVNFCFEDERVERAGELMAEHQVHRLPVLNRDKRLVGIVALADLARSGDEGARAAIRALKGISERPAARAGRRIRAFRSGPCAGRAACGREPWNGRDRRQDNKPFGSSPSK